MNEKVIRILELALRNPGENHFYIVAALEILKSEKQ